MSVITSQTHLNMELQETVPSTPTQGPQRSSWTVERTERVVGLFFSL